MAQTAGMPFCAGTRRRSLERATPRASATASSSWLQAWESPMNGKSPPQTPASPRHCEMNTARDMNAIVATHDILWIVLDTLRHDVAVAALAAGETPALARL